MSALPVPVPEVVDAPSEEVRLAILAPLIAHNEQAVGPAKRHDVAIVVRDGDAIVGGLWGAASYGWLFVQYLALPPAMRGAGHGRALMEAAEVEARRHGCVGIWLDTFSFQARGFYEKLGYSVFGEIGEYLPGESRFFLAKRLD